MAWREEHLTRPDACHNQPEFDCGRIDPRGPDSPGDRAGFERGRLSFMAGAFALVFLATAGVKIALALQTPYWIVLLVVRLAKLPYFLKESF
jgi:hypothetical protein